MVEKVSKVVLNTETNDLNKISNPQKQQKEENLSEILAGKVETKQSKQEDLSDDENKSFFQKHKILTTLGVLLLATLVYSVGRNPVRAAKFLKGNSVIPKGTPFEKGQRVADEIFKKHPDIVEDALKLFKEPAYPTTISESIEKFEKFIQAEKLPENHEVSKAFASLKKKLEAYISQMRKNAISGVERDFKASEKFSETVTSELKEIDKYLNEVEKEDWTKLLPFKLNSFDFDPCYKHFFDFFDHIPACPEEFLNGRLLYHGAKKTSNIYKKGFNPFYSRQIGTAPREIGAGVYLSPDDRVATHFASKIGSVIPVELSRDAKIALLSDGTYSSLVFKIKELIFAEYGFASKKLPSYELNAIMECATRKLFLMAGYDGVYTHKAMKSGIMAVLSADVNKLLGRNQSQVVVFNPEKIEILSRSLPQRIKDAKDKLLSTYLRARNICSGNI